MRQALLLVLMLVLTLGPAEARHHGHRHWGLWGLFSIPHAHRHGYRHHRYARHKTHSRTEAASDGSPGRSYTTAELVPSGWQLQSTDPNFKGQRFASPDGEGSLALYATSAEEEPIAKHMNAIAFVEGEQITHLRSEEDWIEVAGFKADHSFYRKAVLACAGRVWHEVAFEYPTQSQEEITKFVSRVAKAVQNSEDQGCEASESSVVDEPPAEESAKMGKEEGHAQTGAQPLTRQDCKTAGMKWNDQSNVCG